VVDAEGGREVVFPRGEAEGGRGGLGDAVVGVAEGDEVKVLGVEAGEQEGEFVRFGARVDKVADLEVRGLRKTLAEFFGVAGHLVVQVNRRCVLQLVELLADGRVDGRVAVPATHLANERARTAWHEWVSDGRDVRALVGRKHAR